MPGAQLNELRPTAANADVEALTAADPEAQLREVARSIKDRLTSNAALRPSDFVVVFRQVSPHLSLARRVFSEAKLPLDPAAGERLPAGRPFGAWLLKLLRLGTHGWRARDVADVLGAGFIDGTRWGFTGGLVLLRRTKSAASALVGARRTLTPAPAAVEDDVKLSGSRLNPSVR